MNLLKLTHAEGYVQFIDPESLLRWKRGYWQPETIEEVDACGYGIGAGWHPARCGEPIPCRLHAHLLCTRCEARGEHVRATDACSDAGGMFVCGRPVCALHVNDCGKHR